MKARLLMYAIIVAGGKQHRVVEGERLRIDLIAGKQKGDKVVFENVLMLKTTDGYKVGTPNVSGATVQASIVDNGDDGEGGKGPKILVFKRKRRKGYAKLRGHRARFTEIKIEKISV
jgi:large subunit ribosomal protein L21